MICIGQWTLMNGKKVTVVESPAQMFPFDESRGIQLTLSDAKVIWNEKGNYRGIDRGYDLKERLRGGEGQ